MDQFEQTELKDLVNSQFNLGQNIWNSIDIPEGTVESEKIILSAGDLSAGDLSVGDAAKNEKFETAEQVGNIFRDIQQIKSKGPMQIYFINKL